MARYVCSPVSQEMLSTRADLLRGSSALARPTDRCARKQTDGLPAAAADLRALAAVDDHSGRTFCLFIPPRPSSATRSFSASVHPSFPVSQFPTPSQASLQKRDACDLYLESTESLKKVFPIFPRLTDRNVLSQ